jgi:hypothetical protein
VIRLAILLGLASVVSCGYRVAGTADTLPKTIRTVAIPPFTNSSTRYRLTDRLPNTIAREFLTRTRYEVIQDQSQADMILQGSVGNVLAFPTTVNPQTSSAATIEVLVILNVQVRERLTGNVLYNQPALIFRERYEISSDVAAYFDESTTAFDRLSRDVARTVVSHVIERF